MPNRGYRSGDAEGEASAYYVVVRHPCLVIVLVFGVAADPMDRADLTAPLLASTAGVSSTNVGWRITPSIRS